MTMTKKQGILLAVVAVVVICAFVMTILNYPSGSEQYTIYVGYGLFIFASAFSIYIGRQRMQMARNREEKVVWYKQMQIIQGLLFLILGLFEAGTQFVGSRLPHPQRYALNIINLGVVVVLVVIFCLVFIRISRVEQGRLYDQREREHTENTAEKKL